IFIIQRIHNNWIRARGMIELAIIQAKKGDLEKAQRLAESVDFLKTDYIGGEFFNDNITFNIYQPRTWGVVYDKAFTILDILSDCPIRGVNLSSGNGTPVPPRWGTAG